MINNNGSQDQIIEGLDHITKQLLDLDPWFRKIYSKKLGLFPAGFLSFIDWWLHLSISPAKQNQLFCNAWIHLVKFLANVMHLSDPVINEQYIDQRFKHADWQKEPYNLYKALFLTWERILQQSCSNVDGVDPHHQQINLFMLQQYCNFCSPANAIFTNPEVVTQIINTQGKNLFKGLMNFYEDCYRSIMKLPRVGMEEFVVGKNLAITPGKIIYKNDLIELIQYLPVTTEVYQEPILIVPACIMKYYILDLSSHNSLVKYLVSQGHTVFMISWKNPDREDRDLSFDDYINLGIFEAIQVINKIFPKTLIHGVGYCLGGTMLAVGAAYLAGNSLHKFKSLSLLAAQVDFKAAGELLTFIDPSQVSLLQDSMQETGYLEGRQMADAFNLLHSNELIWGKIVQDYFIGERKKLFDIMAWNADQTRLPAKMHATYLEKLFLHNDLVNGSFKVNQKTVSLLNITTPVFAVGTTTDHVAPWRSVYKINFFTPAELTFVLTTGGHNVGIVSPPENSKRSYQIAPAKPNGLCISQDEWQKNAPQQSGSWWLAWEKWLVELSGHKIAAPKFCGSKADPTLVNAPGEYVLKKYF